MWQDAKCVLFIFFLIHRFCFAQLQPVGSWQDHLPYLNAIAVSTADQLIWFATPTGLIRYNPSDNTIERKSSVHGLSARQINAFAADSATGLVAIAYANSTVDLLDQDIVHTITDITVSSVAPDKTIHHVFIYSPFIYLSTAFGIVVVNADKAEVSDTYIIGNNGQQIAVFATTIFNGFVYAATAEGLKRISLTNTNPADFANWQAVTTGTAVTDVATFGQLLFLQHDSLFSINNGNPSFLYASGWQIKDVSISSGKILISERLNGSGRLRELNSVGAVLTTIRHDTYTSKIKQAAWQAGKYWIADSVSGFSSFVSGNFEPLFFNAPGGTALGDIIFSKGTIWAAAGNITSARQPANNFNGLFFFRNTQWTNLNKINLPALDSFPDIVALAVDPVDDAVWAGSFGGGLARIANTKVEIFKQNNGLAPDINNANSYRVSGLAFDRNHDLWITNDGALQPLVVKKKNNSWMRFTIPYNIPDNGLSEIIIDDNNYKWVVAPGYGLIAFDHGKDIDNTADDRFRLFTSGTGNGNLPDNRILSIAKDRNGFIWIGTAKGIGIIICGTTVFSNNACEAILPVVQQDNFPGYLFRDEAVQAIAIDGANRKWIGTRNGVWLISADGDKTIHHFSIQNSPLPDNDIRGIAVHEQTGEVFISTVSGMISFRSDATEPVNNSPTVFIFPNPVPPGYSGTIAIRGLPSNSIVKITETDGRLVHQVRSNGGQATWNGKDYKGRTVSSGVYLVLVADELSETRIAGKIVFIKK
jgi:hypothetical protein